MNDNYTYTVMPSFHRHGFYTDCIASSRLPRVLESDGSAPIPELRSFDAFMRSTTKPKKTKKPPKLLTHLPYVWKGIEIVVLQALSEGGADAQLSGSVHFVTSQNCSPH